MSPLPGSTDAERLRDRPGGVVSMHGRSHRWVVVTGEIEHAGGIRPFESATHVVSGRPSVELLSAADDQVALDLIGSAEDDGALFVTVTAQFLQPNAVWAEDATDIGSCSTVVLVDCSASFTVRISNDADDSAEARCTIHNRRVA